MTVYILFIFIVGYVFISTEHWHRIDKMIPAILMMVLSWGLLFVFPNYIPQWLDPSSAELLLSKLGFVPDFVGNTSEKTELINKALQHHLSKTAEIVVFLIGAMTLVELIDHFNGFDAVQGFFKAKKKWNLLVLLCTFAFFLSAVIDNLTATLVMIAIYRKIIDNPEDRLWFAGFIVIAANAGGAWSPIGDVTTTMLWIGGQITPLNIVKQVFFASLVSMAVPTIIVNYLIKGPITLKPVIENNLNFNSNAFERNLIFYVGIGCLLFVPIFKTFTHF